MESPAERQRRIWREQAAKRRHRNASQTTPVPVVPPSNPVAAPAGAPAAPAPALAPAPGPVPWTPDLLRPLFEEVVPAAEKARVSKLCAKAAPLGPEFVAEVKKDAPWNPVTKATLIASGPPAISKVMNRLGISSEHSDVMIFVTALGSIFASDAKLSEKLDEMVEKRKADERAPAQH